MQVSAQPSSLPGNDPVNPKLEVLTQLDSIYAEDRIYLDCKAELNRFDSLSWEKTYTKALECALRAQTN